MDVGVSKMLTTRHHSTGSSRLVPTRVDSTLVASGTEDRANGTEQTQAWYKTYVLLVLYKRVQTNDAS